MSSLSDQANGKWRSILLEVLELDEEVLDGKHHPCPICGGTDRFRFDDLEGRGTYHCNGCGAGNGLALICKTKSINASEAWALVKDALPNAEHVAPKEKIDYTPLIKRILASAKPISEGDPVYQYLRSRGILNPPPTILIAPTHIPRDTDPMMMVCRIAKDNKLVGVHLTLLKDGARAFRLIYGLPGRSLKGAAIRLHRIEASGKLAVGEGVESSLSASQLYHRPAWSCMNATLLARVELPAEVTDLLVAGDNDATYTGQSAAYSRARKSVVQEHRALTRVAIPDGVDQDWNFVVQS